ncbi:MAG TPA: VOC family protein [Candidatus Acidoferrales bacterium]|nr:VOC family protein [Candidatus Acidoferrales bacterium]
MSKAQTVAPSRRAATKRKRSKNGGERAESRAAQETWRPRPAGVELYFEDLERARDFYRDCLGLALTSEEAGHHAQFNGGDYFICLERKGAENYPSADKAVLFLEVVDLNRAIARIGPARILHHEPNLVGRPAWAVLHDPEGHNILLLEKKARPRR